MVITLIRIKIWWSQTRQNKQDKASKQAIGGDLGFGLVWVSESLIGKESMHNWGEVHQHNGLRVIKN